MNRSKDLERKSLAGLVIEIIHSPALLSDYLGLHVRPQSRFKF